MMRNLAIGSVVALAALVAAPAAGGMLPASRGVLPVAVAAAAPIASALDAQAGIPARPAMSPAPVTVPRAILDPTRSADPRVGPGPVGGPVLVATVPPVVGVHLTVAGVSAVTGPGGRATVPVRNLDKITQRVRLASTRAGAVTVAVTKVLRNASPQRTRSVTVGLNVTASVRLSVVAGTSGVAPGTVRAVRLHSSEGRTLSVDPNSGRPVPLLADRSVLEHGRLVARAVTWTVDSISANPDVSVTVSRTAFDPARGREWVLTLRPVAGAVRVETVPATAGVTLTVGDVPVTTGADGTGTATVSDLNDVAQRVRLGSTNAGGMIVAVHRVDKLVATKAHQRTLLVALKVSRPVTLDFTDRNGAPVPPGRITSVTLRGDGTYLVLRGAALTAPVDLISALPSFVSGHWQVRPVVYSVTEVHLQGSNAVFAGRQRFVPSAGGAWHISLALFTANIRVTDALFGGSIVSRARLTAQDATSTEITIPRGGVSLPSTVRGRYRLTVDAAVVGGTNDILVSGDTSADIRVLTAGDVVAVAGVMVLVAMVLLLLGSQLGGGASGGDRGAPGPSGPSTVRPWRPRWRPARLRRRWAIVAALTLGAMIAGSALVAPPEASGATPATASPAYVYFYQWYTAASWRRAKADTPLIGDYSSADPTVLSTQLAEIKAAGVGGILTSWKNDAQLDGNLQMLIDQAGPARIDLGIVYEALDFARHPVPVATVRSDLLYLLGRWGRQLVSSYFGKPVIIWTGTNEYTPAEVRSVHRALAGRALLLAASKSVADYDAIAQDVDGEAYYWSSSDPSAPNTTAKLTAMGAAVRAHHGIWIAPAAAGFDGRTLGHTRVIARNDGQSLVRSLHNAYASDPGAVGVISWNEWSENTYIEPGQRYGSTELDALARYLGSIHASTPWAGRGAPTPPTASASGTAAPPPQGSSVAPGGASPANPRAPGVSGPAVAHSAGQVWQWVLAAIIVVMALGALLGRTIVRRRARGRSSERPTVRIR